MLLPSSALQCILHAPRFRLFASESRAGRRTMFKGSLVALITPMRADGSVDEKAYAEFVEWQIKEGTDAVVPVGTTGESPTLSHHEHKRAVEIAIEVAKGRVPVIAGAGSNATEEAIDLARHAKE